MWVGQVSAKDGIFFCDLVVQTKCLLNCLYGFLVLVAVLGGDVILTHLPDWLKLLSRNVVSTLVG